MAQGKKSFILYCDQRGIFNKLSDEQAGKLIKHVFSYVNDENPEADFVTELAFESIKTTLKRDLKKYESYVEKQRENGRKGGRPKAKKPKPFLENPTKPKKADSVSVSDNDSVSVSEFFKSEELNKAFDDFQKHRRQLKKPMTEIAISRMVNKLNCEEPSIAVKMLEQSIENGWSGVFPVKSVTNISDVKNISDEELAKFTHSEIVKVKDEKARIRYCKLKGIEKGGFKYSSIVKLSNVAF